MTEIFCETVLCMGENPSLDRELTMKMVAVWRRISPLPGLIEIELLFESDFRIDLLGFPGDRP